MVRRVKFLGRALNAQTDLTRNCLEMGVAILFRPQMFCSRFLPEVHGPDSGQQRVIAAANETERARLEEIRRAELDRLKQVEECASKLERANRLRALAFMYSSQKS